MKEKLAKIEKVNPVHSDDRGVITDVLNENIGHVGLITFAKGAIRGKHYHHQSTQYDYVLSGKLKLIVCLPDGSERQDYTLEPGMGSEVAPGIVHTYLALEESTMIDMTTLGRKGDGYEADTVRVDLPFTII
ncbi:MAG: cupin domain-containing protein [Patescibacteria group bacterium]